MKFSSATWVAALAATVIAGGCSTVDRTTKGTIDVPTAQDEQTGYYLPGSDGGAVRGRIGSYIDRASWYEVEHGRQAQWDQMQRDEMARLAQEQEERTDLIPADELTFDDTEAFVEDESIPDHEQAGMAAEAMVINEEEALRFDPASSELKPHYVQELKSLARELSSGGHKVEVVGYSDSQGPSEYNLELSKRRADSVAQVLINNGVAEDQVITRGYGEADPVATNRTDEGRAENRRAEIHPVDAG